MKILVFGANGKVGSLVTEQALDNGHSVTAFVHGDSSLKPHPSLSIHQGDIYDEMSVSDAVQGQDIVISCLGSWGTPHKDILTQGMKGIIPAMQAASIRRIVSLTGADASAPGDGKSVIHSLSHLLLSIVAPKILRDGERHIELLRDSNLEWTVIRSPVMNDRGSIDSDLSSRRPVPWKTINRNAVAKAMLTCALSSEYNQAAPYITRK